MAVYRQIQTSFWQDDFVLSLTPEEKYFYIYLFTNSKTKQCGIYELPLQIAIVETGYNRETIIKLIQKFIEFGKIAYDWETKELAIKNWMKYNPISNPKIEICVNKELSHIKNKSLIEFTEYPFERVSQKEKEEEQEKEEKQKEEASVLERIQQQWNDFASQHKLATIVKLSETRAKSVVNRLKDSTFDFPAILDIISDSPFLKGQNSTGWKVDFDFVFGSKTNYLKILEGKYSTKTTKEVVL